MNKEKSSEERFQEWWNDYYQKRKDSSPWGKNTAIFDAWQTQESYWSKRCVELEEALEWVFSNAHRQYCIHNKRYGIWQSGEIDVSSRTALEAVQSAMNTKS